MIAAAELRSSPVLRGTAEQAATTQQPAAHVPAVHCHFQMIPEEPVTHQQLLAWSPQLAAWNHDDTGSAPCGADSVAVLWSESADAEVVQWSDDPDDAGGDDGGRLW